MTAVSSEIFGSGSGSGSALVGLLGELESSLQAVRNDNRSLAPFDHDLIDGQASTRRIAGVTSSSRDSPRTNPSAPGPQASSGTGLRVCVVTLASSTLP